MPKPSTRAVQSRDIVGLKYFDMLLPLLQGLHDGGGENQEMSTIQVERETRPWNPNLAEIAFVSINHGIHPAIRIRDTCSRNSM
jgi:hypothetical protein